MTKTIELAERGIILPPEIDDATRREFLIGAAGLLLLPAGCGSDGESGNEPSGETRPIEHALETTRVPVAPERVVTLDPFSLNAAFNVGIKPVGAVSGRMSGLGEKLEDVERVGDDSGFDIESILALEPDLILGATGPAEKQYPRLSEVAPTVLYGFESSGEWKEIFRFYADALNRVDRAATVLADYEAQAEALPRRLDGRAEETEVSILNVTPELFYLYLPDSFPGIVVADAGLPRPEGQPGSGFVREVSRELVGEADGDVIFLIPSGFTERSDESEALRQLREDPLWQQLRAVGNERVYSVSEDYWLGSGVTAANLILDDLEECLLEAR